MFKALKTSRTIGEHYEKIALNYLLSQKLTLITKNYRCKFGEIDLIMLDKTILSFIEVRFRKNSDYGGALASVTTSKQKKIRRSAEQFLLDHRQYQSLSCRFDVVAISKNDRENEINWITSAFM